MSSAYSDVVESIRRQADIVDIISESVALKKSGKNYMGLCPFHNEKSPSFTVSPDKQLFKCFGCNAGGDVFAFLMKKSGAGFPEVVEELAHRYNIPLPRKGEHSQNFSEQQVILKIHEEALQFFVSNLNHPEKGRKAREYLTRRGLEPETIKKFQLGYALGEWESLFRHLMNKGFPYDQVVKAGLASPREKGTGYYDKFRDRLIFPIFNDRGQCVAFGGRGFTEDQMPKYLNSPETPIYHKGKNLYGLNWAKESIRSQDRVIVTEGYLDCITSHQYGFTYTVASLGTALTPDQARLLSKYTESKKIYIAYDTDAAGIKAAGRGIDIVEEACRGVGLQLLIIKVPGGKDPDELLRSSGAEPYQKAVDQAQPFWAFKLSRLLEENPAQTPADKSALVKKSLPLLARIGDHVEQEEYIRFLAAKLSLKDESIHRELVKFTRSAFAPKPGPTSPSKENPQHRLEKDLLLILLESPRESKTFINNGEAASKRLAIDLEFSHPFHQELYQLLRQDPETFTPEQLVAKFSAEPEKSADLTSLLMHEGRHASSLDDYLHKMILYSIGQKKLQIEQERRKALEEEDSQKAHSLWKEEARLLVLMNQPKTKLLEG